MLRPSLAIVSLAIVALSSVACDEPRASSQDGEPDDMPIVDPDALVLNPWRELPQRLDELGLYSDPAEEDFRVPVATPYEPAWPLWSNGSDKERFVLLPEEAQIDNATEDWQFPEGTLFFKTFSYWDAAGEPLPVETRLMRKIEGRWEFVTYVWNEDGSNATASDMRRPIVREVFDANGERAEHTIPNLLQCRRCHESSPVAVLGFTELQLAEPDATGATALEWFADEGWFIEAPPEVPDRIIHPDPLTEDVLGYFAGNCVHCHNGWTGPASSFDLHHSVALENVIDRSTESSASAAGTRVVPGDPESSVLFEAFRRTTEREQLAFMPPVGVDVVDADALEMLREWITALAPEDW